MTDIDFAPTITGGRVRLSTVTNVERPAPTPNGRGWYVHADIVGYGVQGIGPFSSESAAQRWVDANLPMGELP